MLLAAGRGERMGPLTEDRPKPLLEVGGATLIARHVERLASAGIDEIVVNLSYRGDQIRAALGDGGRFGARIVYSQEPEPPLDTAGGIVHALPLLGREPFLLVNSDILTDFEFAALMHGGARGRLVLVPNPPHNRTGDFGVGPDGRLRADGARWTYAGIAVLPAMLFDGVEPGRRPLKPILDGAIARGALDGLRYEGLWLDVGTPDRLERARSLIADADAR